MGMELRWTASLSASCFHIVDAVRRKLPLIDERLNESVVPTAQQFIAELENASLPVPRLLRNFAAWSARIENNTELVQTVVSKSQSLVSRDHPLVSRLAGRVADLENAFRKVFPKVAEELPLRARPLREQWDARGPGLIRQIGLGTDERLIVPNADVILVQPVLGGGGASHLLVNSVRIEAMLVNPVPELPEVLRLGWLLSQLNNDLPIFGENVPADRLALIAPLAMLPTTLAAGEVVELCTVSIESIGKALQAWRPALPANVDMAPLLFDWWETYRETRPQWSVALSALDRMIVA